MRECKGRGRMRMASKVWDARVITMGTRERQGREWTRGACLNTKGIRERKGHGRVKGRTLSFFLSNAGLAWIRGVQINTFREPNHLNALQGTPILLFAQDRICLSFQFAATENIKTINTSRNCTQGLKEWIFRPGFNRIRQERQKRKEKQRTSVCDKVYCTKIIPYWDYSYR